MPLLQEELLSSTPGKFKIYQCGHAVNRQFHRRFASTNTNTLFLWALFLIALTASYLSFQSFIDSGNRYFTASWGGIQWEKRVRDSAEVHRPDGLSVLVTGAVRLSVFVKLHRADDEPDERVQRTSSGQARRQ